jgi:methanogenic corrinoid protein MtbC1
MMTDLLQHIATCIERGKINAAAPYPPDLRGADGADELTRQALDEGIPAQDVLTLGLMAGMQRVGEKFRDKLIYVPDVLLAARAMSAAMLHLKPYFQSNEVRHHGTLVLGTVSGDLHDIGKKLVAMVVEGAGYRVVDLGVDVAPDKFIAAIDEHEGCVVGLSALLTTTMTSMKNTVARIRELRPATNIIVGGAPVTSTFAEQIGASAYAPDPYGAVEFLRRNP